jgi:squalene cyclase
MSVERAVAHVLADQCEDGSWTGFLQCGMLHFFYASAHAALGRPASADVIQDMCTFAERCANTDGSVGLAPGEPGDLLSTYSALLMLRWARPSSPAIAAAERWMRVNRQRPPRIPLLLLAEYTFGQQGADDAGPHELLRRMGLRIWPAMLDRFSYRRYFRNPKLRGSRLHTLILGPLLRWCFWPSETKPSEMPRYLAPHILLDIVPTAIALRRIAGVRKEDALEGFARSYMSQFMFDDGTLLYVKYIAAYIVCAKLEGDRERLSLLERGFDLMEYRRGGWLRGPASSNNIFDTALTLSALVRAGQPIASPAVTKAVAFLRDAQADDGMWSWFYARSMGRRWCIGDSDDTGAAILALLDAGVKASDPAVVRGVAALRRLQAPSGGFLTFDVGTATNVVSVSNTSRAVQALVRAGVGKDDPAVRRACAWLVAEQEANGSWGDFWVARWIYGTVLAIEALLVASSDSAYSPRIVRACDWLLDHQNADGGWGETWFGERAPSSVEHTAMAYHALRLTGRHASGPARRAIAWLTAHQRESGGFDATYVGAYSIVEGYTSEQIPLYWALTALGAAAESRRDIHPIRSTIGEVTS